MNKHIKMINGRKYYYKSVRKGDKVTSEYIGPVERMRKRKAKTERSFEEAPQEEANEESTEEKDDAEEDYIG